MASYSGLTHRRELGIVGINKMERIMNEQDKSDGELWIEAIIEVVVDTTLELSVLAIYVWVGQVMWNNVIPEIFSLPTLTYWQALNFLVLFDVVGSFVRVLNKFRKN
jgi:hypothetical protein